MSVVLVDCTQIKEWNEIIIRHNTFTKLSKKKTNLNCTEKCTREKLKYLLRVKLGEKKLKLYWKCKAIFILKQYFFWLK